MGTRMETNGPRPASTAVVWIDHDKAVIVTRDPNGRDAVELVDRTLRETEGDFEARTLNEIKDEDRVVVSGPVYARTGFERAYVALTHRPDRLVDVEQNAAHSRITPTP